MTLSLTSCDLPSDAVEMGRIADAWGIKGWIKEGGAVVPAAQSIAACRTAKTC